MSMPSRAYTSFLLVDFAPLPLMVTMCQCPLGLIPHFYLDHSIEFLESMKCVNALSGLYLISTHIYLFLPFGERLLCQCPLGLIPHFYEKNGWYLFENSDLCQCPLGLIPHFYTGGMTVELSCLGWCQCPLGLIPHFYGTPSKT